MLGGGLAASGFQSHDRAVECLQLLADASRNPVLVAQHPQARAREWGDRVVLKLAGGGRIELIDSFEKTNAACADRVCAIHPPGKPRHGAARRYLHEIR